MTDKQEIKFRQVTNNVMARMIVTCIISGAITTITENSEVGLISVIVVTCNIIGQFIYLKYARKSLDE